MGVEAIREHLRARIRAEGPISYAEVEAAFGTGGWVERAEPREVPPLFVRVLENLLARLDDLFGRAADLFVVGVAAPRILAHRELLGERRIVAWAPSWPEGAPSCERLDRLGDFRGGGIEGLVLALDLFAALPIRRFVGDAEERPKELRLDLINDSGFIWRSVAVADSAGVELLDGPHVDLEPDQVADLAAEARRQASALATRLGIGLLVICERGFSKPRLLDPRIHRQGSLGLGQAGSRWELPEVLPPALVDLSPIVGGIEQVGVETLAVGRQTEFLMASGLGELARRSTASRSEILALHDDGPFGELATIVGSRGVDASLLLDLAALGASEEESVEEPRFPERLR